MKDPWFVVKRHGIGLAPSGWKGWTCTAVFVVVITLTTIGVERSRGSAVPSPPWPSWCSASPSSCS